MSNPLRGVQRPVAKQSVTSLGYKGWGMFIAFLLTCLMIYAGVCIFLH